MTTRPRKPPPTYAPPSGLSAEARKLWADVTSEYAFDDAASVALLRQLCEALDGIRACQKQVKADGLMVTGAAGQKRPHPLLASEAEYRRAMLACCRALRLTSLEV